MFSGLAGGISQIARENRGQIRAAFHLLAVQINLARKITAFLPNEPMKRQSASALTSSPVARYNSRGTRRQPSARAGRKRLRRLIFAAMSHNHAQSHSHANCGHDHAPLHAPPSNNAAFAIGVTLNLGFVIAEAVYGVAAHSLALLSDAGHNLSDVFGLLIAWGAIHLGKSLPTKHRTYGLRRSTILAALVNAIVLLIVVGGITWEAIVRLVHPAEVSGSTVMWVATVGVVINTASTFRLWPDARETSTYRA